MSIDAFGGAGRIVAGRHLPGRITDLRRFLRAVFDSHRPESEVDGLSDRQLQDIGVDHRQISDRLEREIMHSVLLDMGWRGPPAR